MGKGGGWGQKSQKMGDIIYGRPSSVFVVGFMSILN